MADSPGKVLSSFASSTEENGGSSSKLGGCAGVFFKLLDRFNGKKLFPYKLLPSERPNHNTISHTEEKLPMAKLLLIADENRIGSSRRDGESFSEGVVQKNENYEEKQGKKSVSVVARLMGLERMPSSELTIRERKHIEVYRDKKEVRSTKKLLQSNHSCIEKAPSSRAMDTRIQTLKKRTKAPGTAQIDRFEAKVTGFNSVTDSFKQSSTKTRFKSHIKSKSCEAITEIKSRKMEDPKALLFSKLPSIPPIQVESPLRSILSPSRASNKLLSPIKSPLSSKSTARLFGAAARVLEPSLRPARHLGCHSHHAKPLRNGGVGEDMNKQKTNMLGTSFVPGAQSRGPGVTHDSSSERKALSSSPIMLTECKDQATSRSSKFTQSEEPFSSKQEEATSLLQVHHGKNSNNKLASKKKSLTPASYRQEASSPTNGGHRLSAWSKATKAPTKSDQFDSKQGNILLPVLVKEETSRQDEAIRRSRQSVNSRSKGFSSLRPRTIKGSSLSTVTHPAGTRKSLQGHKSSSQALSETMNQKGNRNSAITSSSNAGKATSSCKTNSLGAQSKGLNSAQMKGGSSSIRTSSKRKASNLLPDPAVPAEVLTVEGGDSKHYDTENKGSMQKFGAVSSGVCDEDSNYYQSDSGSSLFCSLDDINAASSSETESVSRMRVRARWDIADERKKNITRNCISRCESDRPLANSHSCSSSIGREDAFKTSKKAAGILEELLMSLNASTTQPLSLDSGATDHEDLLFCKDGSDTLYDHSLRCGTDLTCISADSSTVLSSFFGGSQQGPSSYEGFTPREGTSIRECESVSDSLCAEECGQPSPVSILESPFQDSASSSSDSFEAPQGSKQWEANANEIFDHISTLGKQIEDLKFPDTQIMEDGNNLMDVSYHLQCIDPAVLNLEAKDNAAIENENGYVKNILAAAMSSAENAVWEMLAFSGSLIDPAFFYQLEEQNHNLPWKAKVPSDFCLENDYGVCMCRTKTCVSFTSRCKEAAVPRRKLLFDCIEEALRLTLELSRQSYGNLVPYMQLSAAHFLTAVYKQIDDWKGLAISMNLDDMMKMEINAGMGRWFKFGNEVEMLVENVETMILRGLMDELMKDLVQPHVFAAKHSCLHVVESCCKEK